MNLNSRNTILIITRIKSYQKEKNDAEINYTRGAIYGYKIYQIWTYRSKDMNFPSFTYFLFSVTNFCRK